jgi:uncharacterized protein
LNPCLKIRTLALPAACTAIALPGLGLAVVLLLLLLPWTKTVHAASFDCTKSKTRVEQKICGDHELSALDETLAETYRIEVELSPAETAESIRLAQKAWLEARNQCSDNTCLEKKYEERISELACNPASPMASGAIGDIRCSQFQIRLAERQLAPLQQKFASAVLASSNNPHNTQQVLVNEERAWRGYRGGQCDLYGDRMGGSDGWKSAFALQCELAATRKRIAYLGQEVQAACTMAAPTNSLEYCLETLPVLTLDPVGGMRR